MTISTVKSSAYPSAKPTLSVLIPFYKDDPSALLSALGDQVAGLTVEVLAYDDGTQDLDLTKSVTAIVKSAASPVRLLTNTENKGRSAARNALQEAARADWVLFLDADMLPAREGFLSTYLDLLSQTDVDVIFGGFEVEETSEDLDRDLHRALSQYSDCLSLSERQAAGPQYVASSNLCVRRSVLDAEPFDSGFSGWGWEDSEWAARVSKRFKLIHADNPALHLGLETTDTLLRRFASSGQNYLRFINAHPDLAPQLSLYNVSKKLGKLPGQSMIRPLIMRRR